MAVLAVQRTPTEVANIPWGLLCTRISPALTVDEITAAFADAPLIGPGQTLLPAQIVAAIRGVDVPGLSEAADILRPNISGLDAHTAGEPPMA